jgi:hypothetical protein
MLPTNDVFQSSSIGALFQHYKGNYYRVLYIARSSESPDDMLVVYQGLHNCPTFGQNPLWVRPYTMFFEEIEYNHCKVPRFRKISDDEASAIIE